MGKKKAKSAEVAAPRPWFEPAWSALGFRLAAAVGALCALLALLQHASPARASLRGATAWVLILALFKVAAALLRSGWIPTPVDSSMEPNPGASTAEAGESGPN